MRHLLTAVALIAGHMGSVAAQEPGADLYDRRCGGCHSLDADRVGPAHRTVFGRRAGIRPGFNYSPALAQSGVIWSRPNLDAWLTNPQMLVPGTAMGFRLGDAGERATIIDFLEEASRQIIP